MAIVNQKNPAKTIWKESSICTKTWNNSVLQFMKVSDMLEADAGFLVRDTEFFVCEIMDCCPWFEFSDLEAHWTLCKGLRALAKSASLFVSNTFRLWRLLSRKKCHDMLPDLYGVGLDALSLKELETISRIHEDGLRQIHTLQKGGPVGSSLVAQGHSLTHNQVLFATTPGLPPMAVGLPQALLPNGVPMHGIDHVGAMGPWFTHTA
ncbi:hypothetical protein SAY86_020806 [Trapa natans]|uniref:Uncharacterized protein n=1 Tax=Trapa natans TaxID=22666 RepID=A0AAN7M7H8_TRANT|nr:hypothetical protein SAY86_020806 [Trapa natans]